MGRLWHRVPRSACHRRSSRRERGPCFLPAHDAMPARVGIFRAKLRGLEAGVHDEQSAVPAGFAFKRFADVFYARTKTCVSRIRRKLRFLAREILRNELERAPIGRPVHLQDQQHFPGKLLFVAYLPSEIRICRRSRNVEAQRFHLGFVEPRGCPARSNVSINLDFGGSLVQYPPDEAQREPAVLAISVPSIGHLQLALREAKRRLRAAAAVVDDAKKGDRIGQGDQTETRDQGVLARPGHGEAPPAALWRPVLRRLKTNSSSTALRPITRKKRYFGMISHHQS